jgi:hypothetical protein
MAFLTSGPEEGEPEAQDLLEALDVDGICDAFCVDEETAQRLTSGEFRLLTIVEHWPAWMIVDREGRYRPELMQYCPEEWIRWAEEQTAK